MAEAAYQAMDVLNFSMKGSWEGMQFLTRTVPFLNARMQGLSKLARGAFESGDGQGLPKLKMAFFMKGMMLVAATMALAMRNDDDENYRRLPEHDRDTYYHWFTDDGQHFAIPKPFEVGLIFSTMVERMYMKATGKDTNEQMWKAALRGVGETFAMNPIPHVVKPMIEQWANKSFFRSRAIVSMGQRGLKPEAQYTAYTSETARLFAAFTADMIPEGMKVMVPDTLMSPVRLEHSIRAYLGTLGAYGLKVSDNLARMAFDLPEAPAPTVPSFAGPFSPIIEGTLRRFIRPDTDVEGRNRLSDELYEMLDDANAVTRTFNAYKRQGRMDAARELFKSEQPLFQYKARLNSINKSLRVVNTAMRRVRFDQNMDSQQKREALNRLVGQRNRILAHVEPLLEWL